MLLHPANFSYLDPNWKPLTADIPIIADTEPKQLGYGSRAYQVECYKKFHKKPRTIFIAPTGSGKSLMPLGKSLNRTTDRNRYLLSRS